MAWFLRSKLNGLPIMNFSEVRKSFLGYGLSKNAIDKIENETEKMVKEKFWSLDDVVSYAEKRQKMVSGNMLYSWLKVEAYLVLFTKFRGISRSVIPDVPLEYIYRAGQSVWFVMDFPTQADAANLDTTTGQNLNFAIPSNKTIVHETPLQTPIFTYTTDSNPNSKTIVIKEPLQTPISNVKDSSSNDTQTLISKGIKELSQENWSSALVYFQWAKETKPQDTDLLFYVGYCYVKQGRNQDAIETFKQAIIIKPDYVEAHYMLGVAYLGLVRYQDAVETFKQAIKIKSDYAEAHCNLGNAYGNLGCYQEAIESCKQAIRIKPDYAKAHFGLGFTYLTVGDNTASLEEYKILKTLNIELAKKLLNLICK